MASTTLTNAFISLNDVINNFIISFTGPGKIIPDAKRTEIVFHARRCLQEFAYETLKSQFTDLSVIAANGEYPQPEDSVAIISVLTGSNPVGPYTITMTEIPYDVATTPGVTEYMVNYTTKKLIFNTSLNGDGLSYTYLSNALTTDESAAIPKLAEEALYACIVYAIISNRENPDPNTLQRLLISKIEKLERSKSRLVFTNFS
jgi:hypothetical protein